MQTMRAVRRNSGGEGALLSHSTILILSGYLIGSGSAAGAAAAMGPTAFWAGVCGLVSFLGLRLTARRRVRRAAEQVLRLALRDLEIRIDRHIPRQAFLRRPRAARPPVASPSQYVTVVRSSRMR